MALKNLLVVVDDGAAAAGRIDLAARIALAHDAHLIGLAALAIPTLPSHIMAELPMSAVEAEHRSLLARAEAGRILFEERMRAQGLEGRCEWRQVEGDPDDIVATQGRAADLVVIGQAIPDRDLPAPNPGALLFTVGRPLLIVPYAGRFETVGHRVLVAWNGGREVARAVGDAMPFLERAARVVVLSANTSPGSRVAEDEPGADIARHLSHHGCRVVATRASSDEVDAASLILNAVTDENCDLVVMGGYGHSRLRELVLGGVTRYMLQHMTVPVLISH